MKLIGELKEKVEAAESIEDARRAIEEAGKDALTFSDFDLFVQSPGNSSLLNLVTTGDLGVGGTSNLLKVAGETYSRMRGPIGLDLAAYSIDVVEKDGECYLPLQTAADVFLGRVLACAVFNGEKAFVFNDGGYFADDIRSVPAGHMSEGFARFNYDELRFLLDTFYDREQLVEFIHGLK